MQENGRSNGGDHRLARRPLGLGTPALDTNLPLDHFSSIETDDFQVSIALNEHCSGTNISSNISKFHPSVDVFSATLVFFRVFHKAVVIGDGLAIGVGDRVVVGSSGQSSLC